MGSRIGVCMGVLLACLLAAQPALGELQNVEVGGEVKVRGRYFSESAVPRGSGVAYPAFLLPGRAIGSVTGNVIAGPGWDSRGDSLSFVEERTRLHVKADFTDGVCAFIELDSYDVWGEDFRSDYVTGADFITATNDDLEVYQAYIEANEMFDLPVRLRIGRQEMSLGNSWLVGSGDPWECGLSFDAIRLTYSEEPFTVDAWWAKPAEMSPLEEDGDVDFYGVYGTFSGIENITIDAYWLLVRDGRSISDTSFIWLAEWMEDLVGVDDYDVTNLHTLGLRCAGTVGSFDFDAQVAYQFGDAHQVGSRFFLNGGTYGDDEADFENWGLDAEIGYTFDVAWQPRVYLSYAWFQGQDNRDTSFLDWINPFNRPEASVSFNRLFSTWPYVEWFSNRTLSNLHLLRAGVGLHPTEKIDLLLKVAYMQADETFDRPASFRIGRFAVPIAPSLSFWDDENDDYLGTEVALHATYHYTEDLAFQVRWAHLFTGDGLTDGQYVAGNGLVFSGGSGDKDADYLEFSTKLTF